MHRKKKAAVIAGGVLAVLAAAIWHFTSAPAPRQLQITSVTQPRDCVLCGTGDALAYSGEDNLGIFSINTFEVTPIPVIKYDERGERQAGPFGYATAWGYESDGLTGFGCTDFDRGLYTGSLSLKKFGGVDTPRVAALYCQACIDGLLDGCTFPNELYGAGVIDLSTGEVRLLEETVTGFYLGSYYVQSIPYTYAERLHLSVLYCPPVQPRAEGDS